MADEAFQPAFILKLPQELLELVVSYLDPAKGLLDLRATCKELCRKTEQIVAIEFFSDMTFLIAHEGSLKILLEISKHLIFSKSMETIQFSFAKVLDAESVNHDRLSGWYNEDHDDEMGAAELIRKLSHGGLVLHYDEYGIPDVVETSEPQNVKDHRGECRQLLAARIELRDSLKDVEYLRSILSNFKAAGRAPAIIAGGLDFTSPALHKEAVGYDETSWAVRGPTGDEWGFEVDPADVRSFEVIMEAICDTNYPVTELELGCKDFGMLLLKNEILAADLITQEHLPERLRPKGFLRRSSAFETLRVLRIGVEQRTVHMIDALAIEERQLQEGLHHLIEFLRQAKNLEVFGVTQARSEWSRDPRAAIFAVIAAEVISDTTGQERALRNIRELELDGVEFKRDDLVSFVRATQSTLRTLTIDDSKESPLDPTGIILTMTASWWREWIRKELDEPESLTFEGDLFWDEYDRRTFRELFADSDGDSEDYDEEEDGGSSLDFGSEDDGSNNGESSDEEIDDGGGRSTDDPDSDGDEP